MIVNLVIGVVGGVWALAHARDSTDEKIAAKERGLNEDLSDLERRLKIEIDTTERNFGETIAAIRQKLTEIELWNRDHLVNKTDFIDMHRSRERFEDLLNVRLDQINKKLDRNNRDAD